MVESYRVESIVRIGGEKAEEKNLKNKKPGKVLAGILIGLGICMIVINAGIIVFVYFFFIGGPAQITKDAGLYRETMHKYTREVVGKVHTCFFAFPESIPESAFANNPGPEFYFSYRDTWDDPTCEVFLECTYSDADYSAELDRLKNSVLVLKSDDRSVETGLEYEESGRFIAPVYKAIDCDNHSYEYAMDLGNNRIAYIYTSFKNSPGSLKKIPKEYLPGDFESSLRNNTFDNGGYNAYVVEKTNGYKVLDYGDRFR